MTHSTESAIAARDAQAALDTRREQQLQRTNEAIARVAISTCTQLHALIAGLGYSMSEALKLCQGINTEHEKLASDIVQDAFHPDMVHEIMRRFGGFTLSDADEASFGVIKNELKDIGRGVPAQPTVTAPPSEFGTVKYSKGK